MIRGSFWRASCRASCLVVATLAAGALAKSDYPSLFKDHSFRKAADDRLLIGTAIMSNQLDDPKMANFIATQFNCITGGNEFKPDALEKIKGKFTFELADKIVAFAEAHDMKVVGHNLCWHQQSPAWEFMDADRKPLSREEALSNLHDHINTVVTHFKGKVIGWDVVNEAISDKPGEYLRDTPARRAIGDDYIEKAFEFAHAADPDVQLYYNDYNADQAYKRDRVIRLIKQIQSKGLRIDAIGIQGHYLYNHFDPKEVDDAVKLYSALGVKVMFTEVDFDVLPRKTTGAEIGATEATGLDPFKNGCPQDVLDQQGKDYGDLFAIVMKYPGIVTRVTLWGVTDADSWLNSWPVHGRTNYPMPFDRNMQPKPAAYAILHELMKGQHTE